MGRTYSPPNCGAVGCRTNATVLTPGGPRCDRHHDGEPVLATIPAAETLDPETP